MVRIGNIGDTSVDIMSLTDDVHGDLNGQGSCSVPQTIAIGEFYECSFSATVSGNADSGETDTVTAAGSGPAGTVNANGVTTVMVTDVLPTISLTKLPSPMFVAEPSGLVTFTIRVRNTGTAESVTLTTLMDDIHGDLDGQGDCSVPQTIPADLSYYCSFTATVAGTAGDSETDTVTAAATDDELNETYAQGTATVSVVAAIIFADGFESGDTSSWSSTIP
ncbi:MAG: hypothetical protein GY835_18880 [bacterium]|nr:hypothetical protein [bacterium]